MASSASDTSSIETLENAMRPGKMSLKGFLMPGDSLTDVIRKDADTLTRLRITCEQIADWMDNVILAYKLANEDGIRSGKQEIMVFDRTYTVNFSVWMGGQTCPYVVLEKPELKSRDELEQELRDDELKNQQWIKLFPNSNLAKDALENTKFSRFTSDRIREALDRYDEIVAKGGECDKGISIRKPQHMCGYGYFDVSVTSSTGQTINFGGLLPHLIRDHQFFESGPYRVDPEELMAVAQLVPGVSYDLPPLQSINVWSPRSSGSAPEWTVEENLINIDVSVFPAAAHIGKALIHKYCIIGGKEELYLYFTADPEVDFEYDGYKLHMMSVYSAKWGPIWCSYQRAVHTFRIRI
jgi:hypothetical protein